VIRGVPVSRGFGEGWAAYLRKRIGFADVGFVRAIDTGHEVHRIEKAFSEAEASIQQLCETIEDRLSPEDEAVLNAYLMTLRDGGLKAKIIASIRQGHAAEFALKVVVLDYVNLFSGMDDPYLKERAADIEAIGEDILANLLGLDFDGPERFPERTILVATDISPTDMIRFRHENLRGIILSRGGETSHATILARSFEIPMVIRAGGVLSTIREGDYLLIDGTSGSIFHKPSLEIIREYKNREEEKRLQDKAYDALRQLPAVTWDGLVVRMGANIGLLSDLELVEKYGADHIGLYRTEFPFFARSRFPDGEEQTRLYVRIVAGANGREVTIRTLDVGGDKFLSYLDYPREDNPCLGWRSIRVSLDMREVFQEQLRAILRASALGPVRLLFPMITAVGELKDCLQMLEQEKNLLRRQGEPFDEHLAVGIMVEVPSAVVILDKLLKYVEFASIGTNDLTQYTLAVDRNNPKVAAIYNPLHPALIRMVATVAETCRLMGKSLSICGESASDLRCAYLFIGMGITELSMNAAAIPRVKQFLRGRSMAEARQDLTSVLALEDTGEIEAYLAERVSA